MTDIILIQPKSEGYSEFLNKPSLPLSLMSCVRLLGGDFRINLIDQRLAHNWKKVLLAALKQSPICVGITCITGKQINHALEISRFIKEHSNVPVVWGGVHSSLLPKQTLENSCIDIIIKGEGEVTFFELVKALKKGKSLKGIKGVWYKQNGKIHNNPDRPFIDLNKLPELPYSLVNIRDYVQLRENKNSIHIQTSRGCPYSCNFCFNQAYYHSKFRMFSHDRVLSDLLLFKRFGISNFWIVDDNFFADTKRVKKICYSILNERMDISWEAPGSNIMDIMKLNNFKLLERSGCKQLYLGVESGSNKLLKYINKNITCEQVLNFNKTINRFDITPWYNFMAGFPTETDKDIRLTLDLIPRLLKENKHVRISPIYSFTPYPGTKLFDVALKAGFVPPSTLEGWSSYNWKTLNLPWVTKKQKEYLEKLYFWSLFLDDKYESELASSVLKTGIKLSLPILKKIAASKIKNYPPV